MKSLLKSVLIGSAMFASLFSFAQTRKEHNALLTQHHNKALLNAANIKDAAEDKKEMHKKNAEEAGKALENARAKHQELKKAIPVEKKEIAKAHHEAIESYHAEAKRHHAALNAELMKEKHDIAKAKEHAKNLHAEVNKAELEHQKLKAKL